MNQQFSEIENISGLKLLHKTGSDLTTMAVGGELCLYQAENIEDLVKLLKVVNDLNIKFRVIGAGSNVLIPDRGVSELVIKLGRGFKFLKHEKSLFHIGAASALMTVSRDISNLAFSGLEFAGGIPASIGGALAMNAGAHASDMSQIVESVEILLDGKVQELLASELNFAYRHSTLPENAVVVAIKVKLIAGDKDKILALRAKNLLHRKNAQPLSLPSAGSIFRNPDNITAGKLLESLGLKGTWSGAAQISEMHANWIVNPKREASSSDVCKLVDLCVSKAAEQGYKLIPELKIW